MPRRKVNSAPEGSPEAAREKCLRLLAVRARSAWELRDRLRRSGFASDVAEGVLADLESAGLVDDLEFARSWIASRQASGRMGRHRLRWELRRKGVADELIERVVGETIDDGTEAEQALRLAQKRMKGGGNDARSLARVRRLLLGRGFGSDVVDTVIRRISSGTEQ